MNTSQSYDIIGLGGCGVDLRAKVPQLPRPDDKVIASHLEVAEGGVTADNVIQAARLGLKTSWIGTLGDDGWSDYLLEKFKKDHVAAFPVLLKNTPTQQFWITTDPKGTCSMVGIPAATRELTQEHVEKYFAKYISRAKHFHTEVAVIPLRAALAGALLAQTHGVKVLLDIDGDPFYLIKKENIGTTREFFHLLSQSTIVKLSEKGLLGLTKKKKIDIIAVRRILSHGPELAVVTLGSKGCVLVTKKSIVKCPGFKVRAVDVVGAGDAFMGGLSYALLQHWDLYHVGMFANACGALKCTRFGTRSSGTLREVEQFMHAHHVTFNKK